MAPSPIAFLFPYIASFVFFTAFSVLYKNNPVYKFTTNLIVGVGAGYVIASMIDAWYRSVYLSMWDKSGNFVPTMILPWILGALYFFIFIPKLRNVYRAASIFTLTVGMGITLPYGAATIWASTQSYAWKALTGIGPFVAAVAFACGISYFLFTSRLDKPTSPFRKVGRMVLLVYTAMNISMVAVGKISLTQWQVLNAIQGVPPTWYIPVGLFFIILIDHFVFPLKRLIPSRGAVAEVRAK